MKHYIKDINNEISKGNLNKALELIKKALEDHKHEKIYEIKKNEIERLLSKKKNIINNKNIPIIFILSERFLPRYGVDRVSIIIADIFISLGYRVILIGQTFSNEIINRFECIIIPLFTDENHVNSDYLVSMYLKNNIIEEYKFNKIAGVFISGWPFLHSIKVFSLRNIRTYFIDYGVNPPKENDYSQIVVLGILADLKNLYLPYATKVLPISNFIERSQTSKIVEQSNINTILLGSDHINFTNENKYKINKENKNEQIVIFLLGRYETGNYKQAEKIWNILESLIELKLNPFIKILADEKDVPIKFIKYCKVLGFINDFELAKEIVNSDVTICLSNWEGFNLPLAESQRLLKPCFVLNIGAHPEVVADPFMLCDSIEIMCGKIYEYFNSENLKIHINESLNIWKEKLTWKFSERKYEKIISDNLTNFNTFSKIKKPQIVLLPITNSLIDPANSGVVRVTRKIASEMSRDPRFDLYLLKFNIETCSYELVNEYDDIKFFKKYSSDLQHSSLNKSILPTTTLDQKPWVIMCEILNLREQVELEWFSKVNNYNLSCIFYDAIPYTHPNYVADKRYVDRHFGYMRSISQYELIMCISKTSKSILTNIYNQNDISSKSIETVYLGADFSNVEINNNISSEHDRYILFVSTLEPRKNHLNFIKAFIEFKEKNPNSDLSLKLVGNRYQGSDNIYEYVRESSIKFNFIEYLGVVSDLELDRLYKNCLFVAYPSIVEGFGLPIVESASYNKLCLTTDDGVLREIGSITKNCLFVNTSDVNLIVEKLSYIDNSIDQLNYQYITNHGNNLKFRIWSEFLDDLLNRLIVSSNFIKVKQK